MDYQKVRQRPRQFESVTGLKIEEFDYLCSSFAEQWKKFYRYHTLEGKKRKHPSTNPGKDTPSLPTIEEKLFFILVYLKNYSLQEMTAASFDFSQSNASKWVKILRPILGESLKKMGMLPEREGHKVKQMLERLGEEKCFQDATERPINRPQDADTQQEFYSGKKKSHQIKNNVITSQNQHILYLGQTHEGTMHDKKIADQEQCQYPDGIHLFQDSGYQGYVPENVFIVQPYKKPRNGELSELKKWFNQYVARLRITVEHAICGIKRCRIVKDKCRHFCQQFRDDIMVICAGLHNFRVCSPFRAYKSKFKWEPGQAIKPFS